MKIEQINNLLSIRDIKENIPQKDLLHIAYDPVNMSISEEKITKAISISVKKLFTKLIKCQKTELEEWEIDIARLYLLKETVYQLHSMNETEPLAVDKLNEARQILKDWLGECGGDDKKNTLIKVVNYEPKYNF